MHHVTASAALRRSSHLACFLLLVSIVGTSSGTVAHAGVFHSKESALRLAFGDVDSIQTRQIVLDDQTAARIQTLARAELPSRLVSVHVGYREGAVVGTAFIETHRIRSLPETLLVVVGPDGRNRGVHLLAFHEPPEYQPTTAWLGQFEARALDDDLALRRGIAGMAGSTLTAQAVTACVRRVMAIHEVCLSPAAASASTAATTSARIGDAATR